MFRPGFDPQTELDNDLLRLKPLRQTDFDGLYAAASDPNVWVGHPVKDRYQREVFERYFQFLMDSKTTLVVLDRSSGHIIGCSRYYAAPDRPDGVAVGFTFLNTAHWGGRTNFELKRLMLDHAFKVFPEVWFHIDPTNIRSQKATAKLGATHACDAVLDLSGTPVSWMCFSLTKEAWNEVLTGKSAPSSNPLPESSGTST